MFSNYWRQDVHSETQKAITNELKELIQQALNPKVAEMFEKISEEDFNKLFLKIFPICYIDTIKNVALNQFYKSEADSHSLMADLIETRLKDCIYH